MRSFFLVGLLLTIFVLPNTYSQERNCSSHEHMQELLKDPEFARQHQLKLEAVEAYSQRAETRALCSSPVILPVAIHFQGVSNPDVACLRALAQNQIDIMNDDFHGTNSDISNWINDASSTFQEQITQRLVLPFVLLLKITLQVLD